MRIAILLTLLATPIPTPRQAWTNYASELNNRCPAKHLDLLAPADLLNVIEDFEPTLSTDFNEEIKKQTNRTCSNIPAGANCNNSAFLQVAIHRNFLQPFVGKVCNLPIACTEQSNCK